MNEITAILDKFLVKSKSSAAFIVNGKAKIVSSLNVEHAESMAAMSAAIISMCVKFLEDFNQGALQQFYIKAENGIVIANQINNSNFIVVFAPTGGNLALLMRSADEVAAEFSTNKLIK